MPIDIPRDRDGSFEQQLIAKHQTRWTGFDDKILSLSAHPEGTHCPATIRNSGGDN